MRVVILGSTGSIGTQALEVIEQHRDIFEVVGLGAYGRHVDLLASQVQRYHVPHVALGDDSYVLALRQAFAQAGIGAHDCTVQAGAQALCSLASLDADVVLNGINGSIGLAPSIAALQAGSTLALANKESVVAGGHLLFDAQVRKEQIHPVDSEHSAIWQALRAGSHGEVRTLIITASGGAFRGKTLAQLEHVSVEQALQHPTWNMGQVVTINSATLMNKGLELIEASRLFGIAQENIEITVHPQSIVHSMVEFCDGTTICQASPPDMRLPIALGLSAPRRLDGVAMPCDWSKAATWTFEPLDNHVFPAVQLARSCLATSEYHTAIMNAANEQAVQAFIQKRLPYLGIIATVEEVLTRMDALLPHRTQLSSVEELHQIEQEARRQADNLLNK